MDCPAQFSADKQKRLQAHKLPSLPPPLATVPVNLFCGKCKPFKKKHHAAAGTPWLRRWQGWCVLCICRPGDLAGVGDLCTCGLVPAMPATGTGGDVYLYVCLHLGSGDAAYGAGEVLGSERLLDICRQGGQ